MKLDKEQKRVLKAVLMTLFYVLGSRIPRKDNFNCE